jgi:hypothetical protein
MLGSRWSVQELVWWIIRPPLSVETKHPIFPTTLLPRYRMDHHPRGEATRLHNEWVTSPARVMPSEKRNRCYQSHQRPIHHPPNRPQVSPPRLPTRITSSCCCPDWQRGGILSVRRIPAGDEKKAAFPVRDGPSMEPSDPAASSKEERVPAFCCDSLKELDGFTVCYRTGSEPPVACAGTYIHIYRRDYRSE